VLAHDGVAEGARVVRVARARHARGGRRSSCRRGGRIRVRVRVGVRVRVRARVRARAIG